MSAPLSSDNTAKGAANEVKTVGALTTEQEPRPHVHLTTYLAIFAVCLVYVAQNFAIVGAGAVS
jgi:hypothetical protein